MATLERLPSRLHHTAYVTKDLEATRHFYEDIIGFPLAATWCESDELFGKVRTYCHCFFEIGDGGALAFFQFADEADQTEFGPEIAYSPFNHIALKVDKKTQEEIQGRLEAAGYEEPDIFVLDHGYCRSLYAHDPNRLIIEFTVDHPDVKEISAESRNKAHAELKRWLKGDHTSNNMFR